MEIKVPDMMKMGAVQTDGMFYVYSHFKGSAADSPTPCPRKVSAPQLCNCFE